MSDEDQTPPLQKEPASDVDRGRKYDAAVTNGQSALRALLTMNGGAILVFLTFLGKLSEKYPAVASASVEKLVGGLWWWFWGIGFALLGYCAIFVSNCFSYANREKASNWAIGVTCLGGFGSLVCFPVGTFKAIHAFEAATKLLKP